MRRVLKPQVSRVLGWLTLVSLVVLALFGLWGAPPDEVQGDAQRLMYLHVPAAWVAYLAFGVTATRLGALAVAAHARHGVGPRRRRVGRARRDLHRAHARARVAVGSTGVGRLVGVGRAARHDRGALLPLSRVPRAAAHPGRAGGAREALRDRGADRVRRRADRALLGDLVAHAAPGGHRVQRPRSTPRSTA